VFFRVSIDPPNTSPGSVSARWAVCNRLEPFPRYDAVLASHADMHNSSAQIAWSQQNDEEKSGGENRHHEKSNDRPSLVDRLMRLKWIGTGMAALCLVTGALAEDTTPPEVGAVDALQAVFGKHPGKRANHAKGIVLDATFTPTAEASSLSKAPMFAGPAVTAIVRFSDPTGNPNIADGDPGANPHGMAVKFTAADQSVVDMAMIAARTFPVATAADFRDFILAVGATKSDSPKPTPIEKFLSDHPAALAWVKAMPATPASPATETYYGLNAFRLVSNSGAVTNVRFRLVPEAGEQRLSADDLKKKSATFLMDEIGERVRAGGVKFNLVAQIGTKDDPTNDATQMWPDDRQIVTLGELVITAPVPDSAAAEKPLVFMPNQLAPVDFDRVRRR
jgi:catalase